MVQTKLLRIGEYGCYFLCLWELAARISGVRTNILSIYDKFVELGYLGEDCLVKEPAKMMEYLVGGKWEYRKDADVHHRALPNEFIIERWEWEKTGETKAHFVLPDWDPIGASQTKRNGVLVSLRVLSRVG